MIPDPANDRVDFLQLQEGDESALNRIMSRWEQRLWAFAWRYLRNAADAQEVVTETFVRLHQQRCRLRPDTNLPAWLFTTVTNHCHNLHRWRRRHPVVELGEAGSEAETPTPVSGLEHDETLEALGAAIAHLPDDLKTAVLLHHYEGWSYREIAGLTRCSERGVETRLYRARQILRAELTPLLRESAVR